MKNNVSIIMYHYVRELKHGKFRDINGLDIELFKDQVKYLVKHYHFITMDELIHSIENNIQLPPKSTLLSFDDGYSDHIDCVLPVLASHHIQGSFYPSAKAIMDNEVLDVNKIHFILAAVADKNIIINELFAKLDQYRKEYQLESNDSYFTRFAIASRFDSKEVRFIKKMLQVSLPESLRRIICDHLFKKYVTEDEAAFSRELYLSIGQVKELRNQGMHIGSHGYKHYWLGSLSKENQELDIDRSLEFLKLVGCDLNNWTMCYPYGSYNNDTIDILQSRNCKLALTTKINVANLHEQNRFELCRLDTNDIPVNENAVTNKWFENA